MDKLSKHDHVLLRLKQRTERNKQRYIKITTMLMLHERYSDIEVAEALGIDPSTVHRYRARFLECGDVNSYLQSEFRGSQSALSNAQVLQLCDETQPIVWFQ